MVLVLNITFFPPAGVENDITPAILHYILTRPNTPRSSSALAHSHSLPSPSSYRASRSKCSRARCTCGCSPRRHPVGQYSILLINNNPRRRRLYSLTSADADCVRNVHSPVDATYYLPFPNYRHHIKFIFVHLPRNREISEGEGYRKISTLGLNRLVDL